jgi:DNA-binding beta-propeller fold protein YncE
VVAVLATVVALGACGNAVTPTATATTRSLACSSSTAPVGRITPAGVVAPTGGSPFSVLPIPATHFAVASMTAGGALPHGALAILDVSAESVRLVRSIVLPATTGASGMALSHNGRWLAVTTLDDGTLLVSVAGLLSGSADPVVAHLDDGTSGQIEAAFSIDDADLFVTDEDSNDMSVFNIARGLASGFTTSNVNVGRVLLSAAPVGIAVSPDGRWIYVTTEGPLSGSGFLWILDEHMAAANPAASIAGHIGAGCNPVRVEVSPAGDMVWITARASDALIGFSAARLLTQPSTALKAVVRVGFEPVGLALYDGGTEAVVANSARFESSAAPQNLTVVDLGAALAGRSPIVAWIAAGTFPREIAIDGALGLVTNYGSNTVEAFQLPG